MQSMSIPPAYKPVTAFVRRAEELDRDAARPEAKVVAYYCRMYAIDVGLKLGKADDQKFLESLMGKLEADKAALPEMTPKEGKVGTMCFSSE
jgi:vacuolar protein sorting-associated protein VTA1